MVIKPSPTVGDFPSSPIQLIVLIMIIIQIVMVWFWFFFS